MSSSSSSSSAPHLPFTLSKIERIQVQALPPEQQHLSKSTKTTFSSTLLSKDDYLNIFKNLNVLFIGDNSIRTLYRHLCKELKYGRPLDYTEVTSQNGKYRPIEDEKILLSDGKISTSSYRDIHEFHLVNNSTKLIYVYLSSIFDNIPMRELNFLQTVVPSLTFDIIISCVFQSDINEKKITTLNLTSFKNYFNDYTIQLEIFLNNITTFCEQRHKKGSAFYWMCPTPIHPLNMSIEQTQQFEEIIQNTDHIIKNYNFIKVDRYDLWKRRKDLLNEMGYFSLHGIREIMDSFARTIGQQHHRSFTPSIPITSLPSLKDNMSCSSSSGGHSGGGKWPKCCSFTSSNSSHPYYHHH